MRADPWGEKPIAGAKYNPLLQLGITLNYLKYMNNGGAETGLAIGRSKQNQRRDRFVCQTLCVECRHQQPTASRFTLTVPYP